MDQPVPTNTAAAASAPETQSLFRPFPMGDLTLPNRLVMSPLTRARSLADGHVQTPLHALYYAQRAGAAFIISEATQISQEGQGYAWTPGIYTDEQVASWRLVTDAVHNAGGRIFCQLWHVGAISHTVFQKDGAAPVSSSAWTPQGKAFVGSYHPDGPALPHPEARALRSDEIPRLIADFRHAARCAIDAGFDGIELHAANGYLIDQFIRSGVNQRTDQYGGSLENRLRLLTEIVDALATVVPAHRIGVRLTPIGGPGGSSDADPETTYVAAAHAIGSKGLAYLHTVRPNTHTGGHDEVERGNRIVRDMRAAFDGAFILNGEFEPAEAAEWIEKGWADAVAFGRLFLANPDLPARAAQNGPYNDWDKATFYGGGAEGYVDYATLNKTGTALKAA